MGYVSTVPGYGVLKMIEIIEINAIPQDLTIKGTMDIDSVYKSNRLKHVIINGEKCLLYEKE
jgi:hypothetical protein